ncbi:MAG: ABC transporter substrate-binding protein [Clostridiales Family XIII bacterium]|nr:ABC transporter substrate-binding protein [Clostridiales Family XIII bacterium]
MKKKLMLMVLAMVMVLAFAGCGGGGTEAGGGAAGGSLAGADSTSPDSAAGSLKKVSFVAPVALDSFDLMALYAADYLGYFEEEGIDVEFIEQLGTDDVKMVAAGTAQFSYPSPGVFMSSIDAGVDNVTAVANYCAIQIFGIATNKDSGIQSFEDLKGKQIALGSEAWTPLFTPILFKAGVQPEDVEMVSFGAGRYEACASGQTPALGTWLNEYYQLLGQGYDFEYLDGEQVAPQLSNALCTSNDIIESDPELVRSFIRAFVKGQYFLHLNPEACADITLYTRPDLKIDWAGAVGAAKGTDMMELGTTEAEQQARIEAGIGLFDMAYAQNAADNLLAAGAISGEIDASKYYTNDFVDTGWDKAAVEADAAGYEFVSDVYSEAHS